jgi:hypothetical protein
MQTSCEKMHNFSFFWIFAKRNYGSTIGSLLGNRLKGLYKTTKCTFSKSALELEASV